MAAAARSWVTTPIPVRPPEDTLVAGRPVVKQGYVYCFVYRCRLTCPLTGLTLHSGQDVEVAIARHEDGALGRGERQELVAIRVGRVDRERASWIRREERRVSDPGDERVGVGGRDQTGLRHRHAARILGL
jgi:hypothetical protein